MGCCCMQNQMVTLPILACQLTHISADPPEFWSVSGLSFLGGALETRATCGRASWTLQPPDSAVQQG